MRPVTDRAGPNQLQGSVVSEGLSRLQQSGAARLDRTAEDFAEALLCAYEGGVLMSEVRGDTRPLRLALDTALNHVLTQPRPESFGT